jgi:hypothetical protein
MAPLIGAAFSGKPPIASMSRTARVNAVLYQLESDGTASVSENQNFPFPEVVIPGVIEVDGERFSITAVGPLAFNRNASITAVRFASDSQVRSFGAWAFQRAAMARLELPATLTTLDPATFRDTPALTEVVLKGGDSFAVDDGVLYSKDRARLLFVPRNRAGSFIIPDRVTVVGPYAFHKCAKITEILFGGTVVSVLDTGAFSGTGLQKFHVPPSVSRLGDGVFQQCADLKQLAFDHSERRYALPSFALAESGITRIDLPPNITQLCSRSLSRTPFLKTVTFSRGSGLTAIDADVFWSSAIETIVIPDTVEKIAPANFFNCENLVNIDISPRHQFYVFDRDVLWNRSRTQIIFAKRTMEAFSVDATVEVIGAYAFCHCRNLRSVSFAADSRLTLIDAYAFFLTALKSVAIPDGVLKIGENAFANCAQLTEVRFGPNSQLRELGRRTFGLTAISDFVSPRFLTKLGPSLFAGSALKTVVLPEGVSELPPLLFFNCKRLEKVVSKAERSLSAAPRTFEQVGPAASLYLQKSANYVGPPVKQAVGAPPVSALPARPAICEQARPFGLMADYITTVAYTRVEGWEPRRGGFATVWQYLNPDTGALCAGKVLDKKEPETGRIFFREVEALHRLRHPAVLPLIGIVLPTKAHGGIIFTEFMLNGSLEAFITSDDYRSRPATVKAKIAVGIAVALRFLHSRSPPTIHRDLKPGNILLDENFEPRLADFGTAREIEGQMTVTMEMGTAAYMAPELIDNLDSTYGPGVDVYAFAITFWELLVGTLMKSRFPSVTPVAFGFAVCKKQLRPPLAPEELDGLVLPTWVVDFLKSAWHQDPAERPSFVEILELFQTNDFGILPGVDAASVLRYLNQLVDSEEF